MKWNVMIKKLFGNINKTAFWLTLSLSAILMVVSFILPPTGHIDSSILQASSILFAFGCLGTVVRAVEKGTDVTLKHGETEISIDNDKEQIDSEI